MVSGYGQASAFDGNAEPNDLAVETRHASKYYKLSKRSIKAVDDISLTIKSGEVVAITGESGSGKSTLLQLIGGLDRPTSGNVLVGGVDINKLGDRSLSLLRGRTIGFVFQSFYLQPFLSIEDNLMVPTMFAGVNCQSAKNKATKLLSILGLAELAKRRPSELSGGQMQRVAIGRAMMNNPKIILADEPTGNLDSNNSQQVMDLLRAINRAFTTTIVIVTHDHALASQADRIIELSDGRIKK